MYCCKTEYPCHGMNHAILALMASHACMYNKVYDVKPLPGTLRVKSSLCDMQSHQRATLFSFHSMLQDWSDEYYTSCISHRS